MASDFDRLIERRRSNSAKWTDFPADVLPLWIADMDFRSPAPVRHALQQALRHGVLGYEFPRPALLETVAFRLQRLYGWQVTAEMIIPMPGVIAGMLATGRALDAPGQGALVQPPIFYPFLQLPGIVSMQLQHAPLQEVTGEHSLEYRIDFADLESHLESSDPPARLLYLCNPHNPSGRDFDRQELARLVELCQRKGVMICSDEIHAELLMDDRAHAPLGSLMPMEAPSVTLISASKTFNLQGLPCAFAVVPQPELRLSLRQRVFEQAVDISGLGLIAAQVAFSGACDDWLRELLAYLRANRDWLVGFIGEYLPEMRTTIPQATYLAWLDCRELQRSGQIQGSPYIFFLEHAHLALSDGATYGPGGEGFVRLNFACPRIRLEQALERMRKALRYSPKRLS